MNFKIWHIDEYFKMDCKGHAYICPESNKYDLSNQVSQGQ